jgi:hypothetical protein
VEDAEVGGALGLAIALFGGERLCMREVVEPGRGDARMVARGAPGAPGEELVAEEI